MTEEREEFEVEPLKKIKTLAENPHLLEVFKDKGYYTLESIAVESPHLLYERIGERKDFNLDKARQIVREARSCLKIEIITAAELLEKEKQRKTYTTGSKALDSLLGGGIHEEEMTEFAGEFESGKTETCMTIAMLAASQGVNVLYWDTEGGFSAG
ncbi:MAG: DNA repair and recombination protein RadA, partial [Candidatus Bathyarchaeia archaeon]